MSRDIWNAQRRFYDPGAKPAPRRPAGTEKPRQRKQRPLDAAAQARIIAAQEKRTRKAENRRRVDLQNWLSNG